MLPGNNRLGDVLRWNIKHTEYFAPNQSIFQLIVFQFSNSLHENKGCALNPYVICDSEYTARKSKHHRMQ